MSVHIVVDEQGRDRLQPTCILVVPAALGTRPLRAAEPSPPTHVQERRARVSRTAALILFLFSGLTPAQDRIGAPVDPSRNPPLQESPLIRVSANLVTVPVSVTDSGGQVVSNLGVQDFTIEEDNRTEAVSRMAEPGETPLDLALLLDVSGSVHPRFGFEQEAALRFLQHTLRPVDRVSIFTIGSEPKLVQLRTGDLETALRTLRAVGPARGSTRFFDAIVTAARFVRNSAGPGARRVQVVLSDGEDNDSEVSRLPDAIRDVQRADCVFYSINPSGPSIRLNRVSLKGQATLEALASQTGGAAFLPEKPGELDAIFGQISAELQAQYLLEYYSSDTKADGAFRQIVVRVPKRPDLRIRARQGYYAPSR